MTPCSGDKVTAKQVGLPSLDNQSRAREAVRLVVAEMLATARSYEEGVSQEDYDAECLHQYRVNLRKARSLINLLKSVYPPEIHSDLKVRLLALSSKSNVLRDLDVGLQDWRAYLEILPKRLHGEIKSVLLDFERKQRAALFKFVAWLASDNYQQEIMLLQSFFSGKDRVKKTGLSHEPAYPLVTKKLKQRYRKICRVGRAITPATPDKKLHVLRIECKKLRYLLSTFGCLYDKKATHKLLKRLKNLQDSLGRFNDCSVQCAFLRRYIEQSNTGQGRADSAGFLLATLEQRLQEARTRTIPDFEAFASDEAARLVRRIGG